MGEAHPKAIAPSTPSQPRLRVVPIHLALANAWVARLHRHHQPKQTHRFSVGVVDGTAVLRGVAIVDRPANRTLDDGMAAEVSRVCTDGCPNACSALYGACRRVAREMGYERLYTYTLAEEEGASLRGSGAVFDGMREGQKWAKGQTRVRVDKAPITEKRRWVWVLHDPTGWNPRRENYGVDAGQMTLLESLEA